VLVDVVSGEIRPLEWKQGASDTLQGLPIKDSVMAVVDENYFDWPVLPEAPSSLNVVLAGNVPKLMWQVHAGNPTGIVVERRMDDPNGRGTWERIASLGSAATEYTDSQVKRGQHARYRVRAINADGESAYSNIVRVAVAAAP
jgi:hypothetical protein